MVKNRQIEYGDFQTPLELAIESLRTIKNLNHYESFVEPTCGLGVFLVAFTELGYSDKAIHGWEINPEYVIKANEALFSITGKENIIAEQDFFCVDWNSVRSSISHPVLFAGNPPWVTNAELGKLLSRNLPKKQNLDSLNGCDAITGRSNFDISEWMMRKIIDFISSSVSGMLFLIKTSVARKLFKYIEEHKKRIENISIHNIDSKASCNVSVDACLFTAFGCENKPIEYLCSVFESLKAEVPKNVISVAKNKLVKDSHKYYALSNIDSGSEFSWRSGIKHDSSKVMEFDVADDGLRNGLGENVKLPLDFLYPMYKSSDISKEVPGDPRKFMLVTQRKIGDDTELIRFQSPDTWRYLQVHSELLDRRKSSIYHKAYRFSIFGVGDYSFKPWKIAISGLYKNLKFTKVGSFKGMPIVLDDTCYSLGFETEEEADFVLHLLVSSSCKSFIDSIVFKDSKRPVTVALLNRINLKQVSIKEGIQDVYDRLFRFYE